MNGSNKIFDASASIYDLLYDGKDSFSETQWILASLRELGMAMEASILEIGSGTGRHARCLADAGYSVTAVDPSEEMLLRTTEHPRVAYLLGDGRSLRLDTRFSAVLALFHVVSYQTSLDDVQAFFSMAAHHLDAGGLFAFDVWYSPAVNNIVPSIRELERENSDIKVVRKAEPAEDTVNSVVEVLYSYDVLDKASGLTTSFEERHSMRHFSHSEIMLLAQEAGFSVLDSREFLTGLPPSRATWGVWFVLRRM